MDGFVTFLVTICLSMVGSWYLQKNLLKGQVMDHITKELSELRTKVNTLEGEIEQLKDDIKEQKKQITDQNALIKDLKSKYEESIKVSICIIIGSYYTSSYTCIAIATLKVVRSGERAVGPCKLLDWPWEFYFCKKCHFW